MQFLFFSFRFCYCCCRHDITNWGLAVYHPPSFTGGGRSCLKAETTINDMPMPQHAQPPPLASICPTTPPRGVVMHVEARRVVGHVKGADGTGRDRMGLDGKGTKTAQYRAPGRPRSSRRHGSIANSIFYRLEASMLDSTKIYENLRKSLKIDKHLRKSTNIKENQSKIDCP